MNGGELIEADFSSATLDQIIEGPKPKVSKSDEIEHQKEIKVTFTVKNDTRRYQLVASNILHETGDRNFMYEILIGKMLGEVWRFDVNDYFFVDETPELVKSILEHPQVRFHYQWLLINKDSVKSRRDLK